VIPYFHVDDVDALIAFAVEVFDGELKLKHCTPSGAPMHAQVTIGDTTFMIGPSTPEWKAMPLSIYLYAPDVDAVYARALEHGATSLMAPDNQFYGDRSAGVRDPQGNVWWLATHVEDMTLERFEERVKERFENK